MHVVPHAIDHSVFRLGDEEPEPILLYPARPWPHKNHTRLFEAFATLRETRPQLRLVLTGGGLDRLEPLPEGVENLGSVPAEHLASLYRPRRVPRLPEPVRGLRAAACSRRWPAAVPVAASNAGAIPEVAGDAAVLFDPTDVEAMATAMLEADTRREELRERGLARRARYTWDETARRHDDVYRTAVTEAPVGTTTTL